MGSCGGSIGFFRSWIWWVQEQDLVSSLLDTDGFCKLQILFGWVAMGFLNRCSLRFGRLFDHFSVYCFGSVVSGKLDLELISLKFG